MSEQQILRLLATIREEVAGIRSRQEELYELLLSFKDQIHEVKKTVSEGLEGLPTSPYIAGQLVPAPDTVDGLDEFGQLLATYLHKAPRGEEPPPRDVVFDPPQDVDADSIVLEPGEDRPPRRGRSRRGPRMDTDLERGPDRGVVPLDLDGPDEKKKKKRRRSRGRRGRKKDDKGEKADSKAEKAEKAAPADD